MQLKIHSFHSARNCIEFQHVSTIYIARWAIDAPILDQDTAELHVIPSQLRSDQLHGLVDRVKFVNMTRTRIHPSLWQKLNTSSYLDLVGVQSPHRRVQ
jgi:hypothetical protein